MSKWHGAREARIFRQIQNPTTPRGTRDSDSRMPIINATECEQIAEQMVAAGWVVVVRVILGEAVPWIVHATRGDGTRHIVHSDEITAAFLELKRQTLGVNNQPGMG